MRGTEGVAGVERGGGDATEKPKGGPRVVLNGCHSLVRGLRFFVYRGKEGAGGREGESQSLEGKTRGKKDVLHPS